MTPQTVLDALKGVMDPDLGVDVVTLKFVKDKDISVDGGRVAVAIEAATPSPSKREVLVARVREAVGALPGVTDVDVETRFVVKSVSAPEHGKPPLPGVKNVIAVGAGKGGVGKTTVSVNLAVALSKMGARVGVLDADIYGPNVPIMFGLQAQLESDGKKIRPAEKYGIQVVSMGFLTQEEAPMIWRGPMLHSAIQQFCREVAWKDIDYLVVDMPPGTGDVALSLSQTVPAAGAIVVTTPQQVSLADSRRAVRMYQKLKIPVLGLVENMSFYECTNCHHHADIFGHGGGEQVAHQIEIPSSAGCRCSADLASAAIAAFRS
jgi:ATP-binding protein involved in chromosome partitioning